jgi:colanic acid/amylovoran biosynthesis glycosyltransferase
VKAPRLAVITPNLGARTETFIRRHVQDLLPGRTVVLAGPDAYAYGADWQPSGAVLQVDSPGPPAFTDVLSRQGRSRRVTRSRITAFMRDNAVGAVLGEYLDASLEWLPVLKHLGVRFVVHGHGYDFSARLRDPAWTRRYRAYAEADAIVVPSSYARARLSSIGLPSSLIHVVPYGVDVPGHFRERHATTRLRCLAVGRLVSKKDPVTTVAAFLEVARSRPDLHLDLVGGGPLERSVREVLARSDVGDAVTLHGALPSGDVLALLEKADIFLQHSQTDAATGDEEGLPVAILEAMSQGLAVVATWHAGIPEAVRDGVSGLLVAEGDRTSMAAAIRRLTDSAPLRLRLGEEAWRTASRAFSWPIQRERLLAVLGLPADGDSRCPYPCVTL